MPSFWIEITETQRTSGCPRGGSWGAEALEDFESMIRGYSQTRRPAVRGAPLFAQYVCACRPNVRGQGGGVSVTPADAPEWRRPGVETPARTRAGVLPPLTAGRLGTPLPPLGCSSHRKRQAAWPALCLARAGAPPLWNRQLRESRVTPQSKAFKGAFSTASPALAVSGFAVRLWPGRLTLRSVVMLFGIILFF